MTPSSDAPTTDPILERRAKISRVVSTSMRLGLGLYLAAMALFFWAVLTRFSPALGTAITVCLLAGSVVLAPAMVVKYAVKAADRADRDGDW